ncbi:MAG: prepilin-type N-terminal cleavage/methylation domain-containing protein [Gemmatimonadales bacterium]|nr:prepilin-type N-terminal cleavage/methylation domain-containing protein [Gemmatimonadales bacterium]
MSRPGGFTLLELLVAIVVAGVVALLVYGIVGVALDTESRVTARRDALQREIAFRAVLTEALRTVRQSDLAEPETFLLEDGEGPAGQPRDWLSFVTAGGTPPLTADADWHVMVEASDDGLTLAAYAEGLATPPVTVLRLPGVTGLDVEIVVPGRVQPRLPGAMAPLPSPPALVSIVFWDAAGPTGPPLLVAPRVGGTP